MVRLVAAAIGSVMRLILFGLLLPWSGYAYFSGIIYATIYVAAFVHFCDTFVVRRTGCGRLYLPTGDVGTFDSWAYSDA